MRISQWGEYGIHCSVVIAQRAREGVIPVSAEFIAETQDIDIRYAQQILQRLRKGGIIDSVRGPHGGYQLSKPASEITLLDILIAAEGDSFQVICEHKPLEHDRCIRDRVCYLRPIWFDLKNHINVFLSEHTLEAMVDQLYKEQEANQQPMHQIGH